MSSGWPQSSFTTQKAGPEATAGQRRPAARFLFALFQFLPPRVRPGARGLGWLSARASAWRPAGRDGAPRGAGAGVRRARRAGGGGGGGGRGAAGATCGPAGDPGSGRSTPPAARTAATGSSRNSCSRTHASLRPASSSSTLGMQLPSRLRAPPAATPQLRANHAQERLPVAPQLHAAVPKGGQARGGATLPTFLRNLSQNGLSQNGYAPI